MTDPIPLHRRVRLGRFAAVAVGASLLALGATGGAVVTAQTRPAVAMAPVRPVAIRSLSSADVVTVRGRVAEIYGNKFVLADNTGRALVDTGPRGEDGGLVTAGESVTVQGGFQRGFLRAAYLIGTDGRVRTLTPPPPPAPPPPPLPGGPHGGPDHGPGAPPPPPPPPSPAGVEGRGPAPTTPVPAPAAMPAPNTPPAAPVAAATPAV